MKLVHWFSMCIALVGVVMVIAGLPKVGGFLILGTTVVEVIYAAVVGKKSNAGTR
jgi:drug/metabolite transporter (DMT)-like permease